MGAEQGGRWWGRQRWALSLEQWPLLLQVKVYIQQLVEGLHYLHSHSILHLDIKVLAPHTLCPQSPGGAGGSLQVGKAQAHHFQLLDLLTLWGELSTLPAAPSG